MRVALEAPQLSRRAREFLSGPVLPFDPNTNIADFRNCVDSYIQAADEDFEKIFANSSLMHFPHRKLRIENRKIDHVNVRAYINQSEVLLPCVLYFTGSGFVYSNLEWQKRNCLDLAKSTGFIVINVQERCAPEHPFPTNLLDAFSVLKWISERGAEMGIDKNNISLCGFSSGGNVAAVLTRWARDENISIKHQVLISPWLDLMHEYMSYNEFGQDFGLQRETLKWMMKQYIPETVPLTNPDVSPLYQTDFSSLAPATIIVGECEPFYDESEIYAARLKNAGVKTEFHILPGQIHEVSGCNRWRLASSDADPIRLAAETLRSSICY
jgi:acetyl esterase